MGAAEWSASWPLVLPLGFAVAAFGAEEGALALGAGQYAVWSDLAMVGLATLGSGLAAAALGGGSRGVLRVRWPWVEAALGGVAGVVVLGVLGQQVWSGAALADGMITPSGRASLLFALWVLRWTGPVAAVAFCCGRAAAGLRAATATSSSR